MRWADRRDGRIKQSTMPYPQAPNQLSGQVMPDPSGCSVRFLVAVCSQSEPIRAMPNMIMSTMNLRFRKTCPDGWHKTSATGVGFLSQQQQNANQFVKFSHMSRGTWSHVDEKCPAPLGIEPTSPPCSLM